MKVQLKTLKPNPFRDFKVDPLDHKQVKLLITSINDYGFWGGAVCRKGQNGDTEVVAGWTRVQAGIESGIKSADLFVGEFDDISTAKAYATENATQRGNTVTALAGSIATAIAMLAREILRGEASVILDALPKKVSEQVRGNLVNGKGIGEPLIERFLAGVPNIDKGVVTEQIANLKKSGDYARIIGEVAQRVRNEAEIEAKAAKQEKEREEAEAKAAEARKAQEQAAKEKREFDFEGVSKHLTNSHQIRAFRNIALSKSGKQYLAVNEQAKLAAALVKEAKRLGNEELTGYFIKINMMSLLSEAKAHQRKISKEEKERLEAESIQRKFDALIETFRQGVQTMRKSGRSILELMAERRNIQFRITDSLVTQLVLTRDLLEQLVDGLAKRSSAKQQKILAKLK